MTSTPSLLWNVESHESGTVRKPHRPARRVLKIKCRGSMVALTIAEIESLQQLVLRSTHVVLDMKDVCYVDSDGLHALIKLRLWSFLHGVLVELTDLAPVVFQLTSLPNATNCFPA